MRIDPLESARLYLHGLTSLHLHRRVDPSEISWFLSRSPPVEYPAGRVVLRQGEPSDSALLVVRGELTATVLGPTGAREVGTAGPWDIVGEVALYAPDQPRSATVRATRDSSCLVLSAALLREARDHPAVAALEAHLLHLMAQRLRVTNQSLHDAWAELDPGRGAAPQSAGARLRLQQLLGLGGRP